MNILHEYDQHLIRQTPTGKQQHKEYCMKALRDYRIASGKSKRAFARMLIIPYTTYCRYEESPGKIPLAEAIRICGILGIQVTQIAIDS